MKANDLDTQVATFIGYKGKVTYRCDKGKITKLFLANTRITYRQARQLIGNDIQTIDLKHWIRETSPMYLRYRDLLILCDEAGMLRYRTPNEEASELLKDLLGPNAQNLYGPIIVIPRKLMFR